CALINPGSNACSPRSTTEPAGAGRRRREAREGDESGGESSIDFLYRALTSSNFPTSMIRFAATATAPFSIGGPSIVTTTRARTIIRLSPLLGIPLQEIGRASCRERGQIRAAAARSRGESQL